MAIRLASSLKTSSSSSSGFDLKFTEGTVYDLDHLFAQKSRDSDEESLYIQVKKNDNISKKVFERIKNDLRITINEKTADPEVKEKINNIVRSIVKNDNIYTRDIPVALQNQLNLKITDYLNSLTGLYGINYSIVINGNNFNITYKFENDSRLKELFTNYYNTYKAVYTDELGVGSGQLGILDKKQRENISLNDCKKYLFCNCFEKPMPGNMKPLLTGYRPVVIWENGTDDENTESDNTTLYSNINEMMIIIRNLKDRIASLEGRLVDNINIDEYNNLITDKDMLPTVGAVYDYAQFAHEQHINIRNGIAYTSGMYFQLLYDIDKKNYYEADISDRYRISIDSSGYYSVDC